MEKSRYATVSPAQSAPTEVAPPAITEVAPPAATEATPVAPLPEQHVCSAVNRDSTEGLKIAQATPDYNLDPSIDEFAQTRPPDDLFDDDFVPIPESEPVPDPTPVAPEPEQKPLLREPPRGPRGHGGKRGGAQRGGRTSPPKPEPVPVPTDVAGEGEEEQEEEGTVPATASKVERKEGAVRGDRSGTGGIKKVFTNHSTGAINR
jgi:hypothetical protein